MPSRSLNDIRRGIWGKIAGIGPDGPFPSLNDLRRINFRAKPKESVSDAEYNYWYNKLANEETTAEQMMSNALVYLDGRDAPVNNYWVNRGIGGSALDAELINTPIHLKGVNAVQQGFYFPGIQNNCVDVVRGTSTVINSKVEYITRFDFSNGVPPTGNHSLLGWGFGTPRFLAYVVSGQIQLYFTDTAGTVTGGVYVGPALPINTVWFKYTMDFSAGTSYTASISISSQDVIDEKDVVWLPHGSFTAAVALVATTIPNALQCRIGANVTSFPCKGILKYAKLTTDDTNVVFEINASMLDLAVDVASFVEVTGKTCNVTKSTGNMTYWKKAYPNYVYLQGTAGNYLSILEPTARIVTTSLVVQYSVKDCTKGGSHFAWRAGNTTLDAGLMVWHVTTTNAPRVYFGDGITGFDTGQLIAGPGFAVQAWKITWLLSGTLNVEYTLDDTVNEPIWTLLATYSPASVATFTIPGNTPMALGQSSYSAAQPSAGKFTNLQIVIDGLTTLNLRTSSIVSQNDIQFTALTGQTVDIVYLSSGLKPAVVGKYSKYLMGTNKAFKILNNALIDFDVNTSFTAFMLVRRKGFTSGGQLFNKRDLTTLVTGWGLQTSGSTDSSYAIIGDNVNPIVAPIASSTTVHELVVSAIIVDRTTQTVTALHDNTKTTSSIQSVRSTKNNYPIYIGQSQSDTFISDMELIAVCIADRVISDAEFALIREQFDAMHA